MIGEETEKKRILFERKRKEKDWIRIKIEVSYIFMYIKLERFFLYI